MDRRCALPIGYELKVKNSHNGEQVYKIKTEVARGGSCIVYDATYLNNSGVEKLVRVKECYPFKLDVHRNDDGRLLVPDAEIVHFEEYKKRLHNAFDAMNELFMDEELTNSTSNSYDIYFENNTIYVVTVYVQGDTLSKSKDLSFKEAISVVKATAKAVKEIHRKGYLYLDIKPDNIWVLKGTTELIQLFDFDSMLPINNQNRDMSEYRISYTKGFAAYELQMGEMSNIGPYSDVYGIGALLFNCIFGRVPNVLERDIYTELDYSGSVYEKSKYRNALFVSLTEFFHKTLSDYYADRYADMDIVISELEKMEILADETTPFIFSSEVVCEKKLIGREKELQQLLDWYRCSQKTLYVTGIRGIGRSSLVRRFILDNKEEIGTFVYLEYKSDIVRTIIDDRQFKVNGVERNPGEDDSDYYTRKIQVLHSIAYNDKFLLVVNNYSGENCEELRLLQNIGCKIIFITHREHYYGENELNVLALADRYAIHSVFEYYIGSGLRESERRKVDAIYDAIAGHTLVFVLVAKQILSSRTTIENAAQLTSEKGFTQIGLEKIRYEKDDTSYYATIANIINAIFDASEMEANKKSVLKAAAIFGTTGVRIKTFGEILNLENLDVINELQYDCWLESSGDNVAVHPVICEVIHTWEQDSDVDELAIKVMSHVYKVIRLENHREDYPRRLLRYQRMMLEEYDKNGLYKKLYDRMSQGVIGEIVSERMKRGGVCNISNLDLLEIYLGYAENIIVFSQRDKVLHATEIYKNLLYETIIAIPCDREDFIMTQSDELVNDKMFTNPITMMRLYECRVSIYCERADFEAAAVEIDNAKSFLNQYRNYISIGKYYDIRADYYDALLGGAYETTNESEEEYLSALIESVNNAIKFTRRSWSKYSNKLQLIKCLLSKVNILVRSGLGSEKEIDKILDEVQSLILKNCQPDSSYIKDFYMTCAWYATRFEKSYKAAAECAMKAAQISVKTATSDIQCIDEIIIPFANMLLELECYDKAIHWLNVGVESCDAYPQIIPYIRKKVQLYCCMVDVYDIMGDYKQCEEMIRVVDNLRLEYSSLNIPSDISEDIRLRVLAHK